jgi:ketosteroid isomerase-like protein
MRIFAVALAGCLFLISPAAAQSTSEDEKQIRDIIARYGKGEQLPATADRIFWTSPYRRPVVGKEKPEEIPGDMQPSARVEGSFRSTIKPIRIEVAKSGDLAYEFSTAENTFDLKSGKQVAFTNSVLRVWRKEDGEWKVAAMFARPHAEEKKEPAK